MDPITLVLRSSKSPPASAPVGGELSSAECDANWDNLKTAAEQLDAEKLSAADAQEITDTLTALVGTDEIFVLRGGVVYRSALNTVRSFLEGQQLEPSLVTNSQTFYGPTVTQPSSGLAIVQEPNQSAYTSVLAMRQNLSAVGSGNAIAVTVLAPTSGGTPTMSDSVGGTWGAALHSYAGAFGNTFWFFTRANVTGNPTWVEATFGGAVNGYIAAVEVSGAGSSLVADDTDGAAQSASTAMTFPYTSTVDDTLFLAACTLSNGSVPTGVSPVAATGSDANFQTYGRGIIASAGSGTAQINLADSRSSDKGWVILRPGP